MYLACVVSGRATNGRRSAKTMLPAKPRNFDLHGGTLTIEAACSKHRKTDVLPLHPDLLAMLREWFKGHGTDDPLFPNLGKRKTWLMV